LPIIIDSFVGFGKEDKGKENEDSKKFFHFCTKYVRGCGLDVPMPKKQLSCL